MDAKGGGLTYPNPDVDTHPLAEEPRRRPKRPRPARYSQPTTTERGVRLPEDSAERKNYPIITGFLDYFPDAVAELARLAKYGNDKHNPGERLHWSREKANDHVDCIGRHLIDRGRQDDAGFYHDVMIAWRAMANLQLHMERRLGLPPARGTLDAEAFRAAFEELRDG